MERGTRLGRYLACALLVPAVLAAALLAGATPAAAHAVVTASDPRRDSVLTTPPDHVTVTFSEAVGLSANALRVLDPEGRPVHTGSPGHADGKAETVRVELADGLAQGTYTVSWRATSADSHAISGAFVFSVGAPSRDGAASDTEPNGNGAVDLLQGIGRYVAYAGLSLLLGVAVFGLVCWPGALAVRAVRRLLSAGWWALAGSTLLLLVARAAWESGGDSSGPFDPRLLWDTVGSRQGLALTVRLALLPVAAVALKRWVRAGPAGRAEWVGGAVLAAGLAGTWAVSDHASAGVQVPVAMVSSVVHLLAMSVWLGGLAALFVALARAPLDTPVPGAAVVRFSRLALGSVAALAVSGVYQSWRGLGSWEALATPYGRILLVKTGVVAAMLAVAAYSRNRTRRSVPVPVEETVPVEEPVPVPAGGGPGRGVGAFRVRGAPLPEGAAGSAEPGSVETGPRPAAWRRGLRRSVAAEALLGAVVLVVTTVLTGTQPGRADAETVTASRVTGWPDVNLVAMPFDTGGAGITGSGKIQITLEPSRVGRNAVEAVVLGADGGFVSAPELRLTFTHAEDGIGPLDAGLVDRGSHWSSDTLTLPVAGTWTMRATVRTSELDQVTVEKTVEVVR
ncbi:copper resistance protein CopC [Streptomyces sp. NPDC006464]|uniref:copper resistance CopC/CopD family protein n=1 Tax=Streptomyces sp. NPDC006464 TaxID=3154305 RepID=UPI0033AA3204